MPSFETIASDCPAEERTEATALTGIMTLDASNIIDNNVVPDVTDMCDGGGEFCNKELLDHFNNDDIKLQIACPSIPRQNGVAERRHRIIREHELQIACPSTPQQKTPVQNGSNGGFEDTNNHIPSNTTDNDVPDVTNMVHVQNGSNGGFEDTNNHIPSNITDNGVPDATIMAPVQNGSNESFEDTNKHIPSNITGNGVPDATIMSPVQNGSNESFGDTNNHIPSNITDNGVPDATDMALVQNESNGCFEDTNDHIPSNVTDNGVPDATVVTPVENGSNGSFEDTNNHIPSNITDNGVPDATVMALVQNRSNGCFEDTNDHIPSPDQSIPPTDHAYIYPNMYPFHNRVTGPIFYQDRNGTLFNSDHVPPNFPGYELTNINGNMQDAYQYGYGCPTFAPYPHGSLVPTLGHDGQLHCLQQYQGPVPYFMPTVPTCAVTNTPTQTPNSQGAVTNSSIIANSNGMNETVSLESNLTNGRNYLSDILPHTGPFVNGSTLLDCQNMLVANTTVSSPVSHARNIPAMCYPSLQVQQPFPNFMGLHPPPLGMEPSYGFYNNMHPNIQSYGSLFTTDIGFMPNGQGLISMDNNFRGRGRSNVFSGYGNKNADGLNELNRGPRSDCFKNNQKVVVPNVDSSLIPNIDQYNKADFPENYSYAKFYVIKSYSEDDIHKSVKYGIWASTPNGNKKLAAGYKEAQEISEGCPVFLFFSVNTSGQFVGVGEMVGVVDFNTTVDYWQQDKWNGCFPVKWHIVKDIPNIYLKHITLENNDNKPMTNSRDTQEINFAKGIQLLKIFKDYNSPSNIFDDFAFYETRQKAVQEKKAKQQLLKQVCRAGDIPNADANGSMKDAATNTMNEETDQCEQSDQNEAVEVSVAENEVATGNLNDDETDHSSKQFDLNESVEVSIADEEVATGNPNDDETNHRSQQSDLNESFEVSIAEKDASIDNLNDNETNHRSNQSDLNESLEVYVAENNASIDNLIDDDDDGTDQVSKIKYDQNELAGVSIAEKDVPTTTNLSGDETDQGSKQSDQNESVEASISEKDAPATTNLNDDETHQDNIQSDQNESVEVSISERDAPTTTQGLKGAEAPPWC